MKRERDQMDAPYNRGTEEGSTESKLTLLKPGKYYANGDEKVYFSGGSRSGKWALGRQKEFRQSRRHHIAPEPAVSSLNARQNW